jgi:hypothetical protein
MEPGRRPFGVAMKTRRVLLLCALLATAPLMPALLGRVAAWFPRAPEPCDCTKRTLNAEYGDWRLWTEEHVHSQQLMGGPHHVVVLEDTRSGRSTPLFTCLSVFQERSMEPEVRKVAGPKVTYASGDSTIEVVMPNDVTIEWGKEQERTRIFRGGASCSIKGSGRRVAVP